MKIDFETEIEKSTRQMAQRITDYSFEQATANPNWDPFNDDSISDGLAYLEMMRAIAENKDFIPKIAKHFESTSNLMIRYMINAGRTMDEVKELLGNWI